MTHLTCTHAHVNVKDPETGLSIDYYKLVSASTS
jgi:hypothetical protein